MKHEMRTNGHVHHNTTTDISKFIRKTTDRCFSGNCVLEKMGRLIDGDHDIHVDGAGSTSDIFWGIAKRRVTILTIAVTKCCGIPCDAR
jgi:hypothetical protein